MKKSCLSKHVKNLILDSWAKGSKRQYKTYIEQWTKFCKEQNIDLKSASIAQGTEFLLLLYKKGLGYLAINTAASIPSPSVSRQHRIWKMRYCHKNIKRNLPKQARPTKIYCMIWCRYSPKIPSVTTTMELNLAEVINP